MTTIILLGNRLRPLESIERTGAALGLKRTTAFKRANKSWPLDGDPGERLVIVTALAEQLGIPYSIEPVEDSDHGDAEVEE